MLISKQLVPLVCVILSCSCAHVCGQYSGGGHYGGGMQSTGYNHRPVYNMQQHGYGYGHGQGAMDQEEQEEERPRINFGIRLRVPAMKLELPRFNLPKITVTAKIRQPDGPRVIRLPAINLDTSSRVEQPGEQMRGQAMQQQQQQSADDQVGFDDEHEHKTTSTMNYYQQQQQQPTSYYRHPNSPASRARQQQHYRTAAATNANYGSYERPVNLAFRSAPTRYRF